MASHELVCRRADPPLSLVNGYGYWGRLSPGRPFAYGRSLPKAYEASQASYPRCANSRLSTMTSFSALGSQSGFLTDLANDTGWADLAISCHLRSKGWNKLIRDKATVSILMFDKELHLDGPHRDAIGTTVHEIAVDVAKRNNCEQVTPAILGMLDGIAVSP
jgi:hypothetical protein